VQREKKSFIFPGEGSKLRGKKSCGWGWKEKGCEKPPGRKGQNLTEANTSSEDRAESKKKKRSNSNREGGSGGVSGGETTKKRKRARPWGRKKIGQLVDRELLSPA